MGKEDIVLILCVFIISFSAIYVSAQTCDDTAGNFKPSSPYDKNRRLINSTLASNITSHNGWVNGSIGLGPNIVYDMGMCSPGAGPDSCSSCIKDSTVYYRPVRTSQTLSHGSVKRSFALFATLASPSGSYP